MTTQHPFVEVSPWFNAAQEPEPALQQDIAADVVIIGGGYVGLSTALTLRAAGADVVILEQGVAGSGASGRNAGHLTPTIGKDLPTTLRLFGRKRAAALVRFADAAVEHTEQVIQDHEIDCRYEATGNIIAGLHPKHISTLEQAAETARSLGAAVRFLPEGEMRERGVPPAFLCGVLEERGGTLNPGLYVAGLRQAALRAGVRLFEETRVLGIDDGARVEARTEGGTVTANHAVIATNAYTEQLGRRKGYVTPLRVSLFETEPLSQSDLDGLGWKGREGIYTAHEALENYRLTAHGTLSGGSKVVRYRYGSKLPPGRDPEAFDTIEQFFRERFPTLRDVRIVNFWGGWIGFTFDLLPQLGVEGTHQNVHFGVGFNGHGVAQATLVGSMIAERILGKEHPHAAALGRRLRRWPPEPLRWVAAELINRALALVDARTDRQVRRLNQR
ncbi:MAG: FAD-binding oxidoreductase [Myxococcota bacterium]|jgi:glycine/D-amino acid oxidase-like deaminating enzyme|nr:FAD-binding oxidoreductase [Myxococcota bacterium]